MTLLLGPIDLTGADTVTATAAVPTVAEQSYGPAAIIGLHASPASGSFVALIGDSIMSGYNDTNYRGYAVRALEAAFVPYQRVSHQAEASWGFTQQTGVGSGGSHRRRGLLLQGCTHAIYAYGINDVADNGAVRTLVQMKADALSTWWALSRRRMMVHACTLTPWTTTTDAFATLANQTVNANEAKRTGYNDWLRDGAPIISGVAVAVGTHPAVRAGQSGHPLTGYYEVADTVESSRNSGKWKVTGAASYATSDGLHPSPAAHALMAAAITTANYVAAT